MWVTAAVLVGALVLPANRVTAAAAALAVLHDVWRT